MLVIIFISRTHTHHNLINCTPHSLLSLSSLSAPRICFWPSPLGSSAQILMDTRDLHLDWLLLSLTGRDCSTVISPLKDQCSFLRDNWKIIINDPSIAPFNNTPRWAIGKTPCHVGIGTSLHLRFPRLPPHRDNSPSLGNCSSAGQIFILRINVHRCDKCSSAWQMFIHKASVHQ